MGQSSQSTKDLEAEAARESQVAEDNLVAFFEALDPKARAEYAALVARDKEFGEDIARERASQ